MIEALFVSGLSDRSTPRFQARLLTLGIDVQKLLPGYDYSIWENGVLEAVSLFPELDRVGALEELGRRMVKATVHAGPVGESLMPLLKLLAWCARSSVPCRAEPLRTSTWSPSTRRHRSLWRCR